ncbi:flagellar filament capping protein FliD [uncultured Sphingomonas sp.]|uniref:flagellar filament capping protein FliD n=1 Tax=uncultured Sphingomonas sp. TaxID=158754 RepID=UPI0025E8D044|nr:flagellar filament capping protein FliD [uncultured Sphingomonas sp.]
MASITNTLGVGSGLDVTSMVTNLVSASYDPKLKAQTDKETANTAKISTLASLTGGLTSFSSALNTLLSGGTLQTQPTTSDASIITAVTKSGATIGAISEQLEVRQLAQAQSLVSGYVPSAGDPIGKGGFSLTVGSTTTTIAIDDSNDSLAGLARAINAAGAGVTASVVTDGNGARLALKGQMGAANAFSLTLDAGSDDALQAFTYGDGDATGMIKAQSALDAIVRKDGIDISRPTNTISDLVDGVSINLLAAKHGTMVSLGFSRPTAAITQAVNDFVAAYNELKKQVGAATTAGASGNVSGALFGHGAVKQMEQQLARLPSTTLQSGPGPQTLAEIGVSTGRDGMLSVDSAALSRALASYPDAVEGMFNPQQRSSSPLVSVTSAAGATKPGTYAVTDIVAGVNGGNASGKINGEPGLPNSDGRLYASTASGAGGLIIKVTGNVANATVTVDAGISGALKSITDALTRSDGLLSALSEQFSDKKIDLAEARLKLETAQAAYKDQLTTNFSRMETQVNAYKATQSYLTQQIAVWTKS